MDTDMDGMPSKELVEQLLKALKDRTPTDKQLEEINGRLQVMAPQLAQLQRDVLVMQGDMRTQFVPRSEYEPRHQQIVEKIQSYDQMVAASRPQQERFVRMETRLENVEKQLDVHNKDLEALDLRQRGAFTRALPIISAVIAALALVANFLQHLSFH